MARVHEIAIASDTRRFESNIKSGVIDPVKDAQDAFDKLADAADDAGDTGTRSLDKFEDELKQVQRQAGKTERAAKDIGQGSKSGFSTAGQASSEFKDEALSNFSEITSSFDGSMESVGELAQGTLGGLASTGLPAIGIAAGVAAAGIGLVSEAFTKAEEKALEARDAAFSFAYDVAGALEAAGYTDRVNQWTSETEKFKQAQDLAKASGLSVVDTIDALASGGPKLDTLTDAFHANNDQSNIALGRIVELDKVLGATADGYISGADAAKIAAKANYDYAAAVGKATGETDDLGNAIVELPDGKQIVIDAKTETAYEDLDAIEKKKLSKKTLTIGVDDSAVRNYRPPNFHSTLYINRQVTGTAGVGNKSWE